MDSGTYKVILAPLAIQDLAEAVSYIAADNPRAAERFGRALINQTKLLSSFPEIGRFVPEFSPNSGAREIIFRSYRIIYRLDHSQKTAEVSRFWHAARGAPEIPAYGE